MSFSSAPSTSLAQPTTSKIVFIDNLKVLLTALVIVHHALVTYGAPGGWYYSEKTELEGAIIPMTCTFHEQSEVKRTNIRTCGYEIFKRIE